MRTLLCHVARAAVLPAAVVVCLGCSALQSKPGTLVAFDMPAGKKVSRTSVAALSRYLVMRTMAVLDAENARVESVSGSTLLLFIPNKNVSKEAASGLLSGSGLEFHHLRNVATAKHPTRAWRIQVPSRAMASYRFIGSGGRRLDSRRDSGQVLSEVVGQSSRRPVLTGEDIIPNAVANQTGSGWAVQVEFTERGKSVFHKFTRENRGEYLAVFYDGNLISAPVVTEAIASGEALITGFRTGVEANMAASQINAGVLPVRLRVRSVKYVGKP